MRYCPILFCFPLREDDFVDKEDQHQNVTVEHRGSDVIDKVRHQQARNRRSHAVDEVNEAGDQTECQHQAICLARSTLPRNTKLRWIRYRIFIQSRENGRVRAQNGSCNLACLAQTSNVHQQLRFMAGIWTTAISYKSKAALSMWTLLGGNTQRVHFFYFIDSASIRAILLF